MEGCGQAGVEAGKWVRMSEAPGNLGFLGPSQMGIKDLMGWPGMVPKWITDSGSTETLSLLVKFPI